jgi:Inovirus Coat protein B
MKKIVLLSAVGFSAAALSSPSFAAVDPAVMTAIATGGTDAATIGGAILALVIAIAIYRHIRGAK